MHVQELQNGQVVRARWGRYRDDMIHPDWGPWQDVRLYVQRAQRWPGQPDEVVLVTLADPHVWAEYSPMFSRKKGEPSRWDIGESGEHVQGVLECEGYYLQIDGLTR